MDRAWTRAASAFLLVLAACASSPAANNRALLIGISQYADPEMNDLAYADEDVKTFGSILKNFADYGDKDMTVLINDQATKQRISAAILEQVKDSQKHPVDRFILMYAGHGLPSTIDTKKTNSFLAPHDAYLNQFFPEGAGDMLGNETFINKAWLVRQLSAMNAKNVIIILDSCYSGAKDFGSLYADNLGFKTEFETGGASKRGITVVRKKGADGKADPAAERHIAFLASSRENQPSAEYKELRHGALSYTMFQYLDAIRKETEETEHKEVTVEGMYSGISGLFDTVKVHGEVLSRAHQPVLVALPSYDDVKGMEFVSMRGIKVHEPAPLVAQVPPEPAPTAAPAAPPPPPVVTTGEVYLDTGEDQAEVYVDGAKTGRSSNGTFELEAGKHMLSLYLRDTNYNRTFLIGVKAGEKSRVSIPLRGILMVESRSAEYGGGAPDLDVYLDGRSVGRTALRLSDITAGTHMLRVIVSGVAKTRQVEIRPDSPLLVRYKVVVKKVPAKRDDNGAGDVTF